MERIHAVFMYPPASNNVLPQLLSKRKHRVVNERRMKNDFGYGIFRKTFSAGDEPKQVTELMSPAADSNLGFFWPMRISRDMRAYLLYQTNYNSEDLKGVAK